VGKEGETPITKAKSLKRVIVIGGGPGGMNAAQVAAQRGHAVSLYEKKERLGGMVLMGSKPPQKSVLMDYIDYLGRQLENSGVDVKRNTTVTPQMFEKEKPDVLVIATGSQQVLPDIPGIESAPHYFLESVYAETADLGNHTVIVGGGGTGAEGATVSCSTIQQGAVFGSESKNIGAIGAESSAAFSVDVDTDCLKGDVSFECAVSCGNCGSAGTENFDADSVTAIVFGAALVLAVVAVIIVLLKGGKARKARR